MGNYPQEASYRKAVAVFGSSNSLSGPERALHSVEQSDPVVGITSDNGIVLVATEHSSEQYELPDEHNIHQIDEHIGCVTAGEPADTTPVVEELHHLCMQNRSQFGSPLSPQTLARKFKNRIDDIINYNTERSHGVVVLFGGVFREEPYLYRIGPYGTTRRFTSTAAGKGWNMMMNQLEERPNATLDELEEQGIEAVSRVCDVDSDSVSLSVVQIPVETGTYTIDSEVATLTERNDT